MGAPAVATARTDGGADARQQANNNTSRCSLVSLSRLHTMSAPKTQAVIAPEAEAASEQAAARWPAFLKALVTVLKPLNSAVSSDDENILRICLDPTNTGAISQSRFTEYLKGFGPLKRCIPYMRELMNEKWFYGYLPGADPMRLLLGQPTGAYMMKFAGSEPSSFGLFFVWSDGNVLPVHVTGAMPEGVKVKEPGVERCFDTLYDLLNYYKKWLASPFQANLAKESWFYGDITEEEVEKNHLRGARIGTFLFRYGRSPNLFWCSYVGLDGNIVHTQIRCDPVGNLPQEHKASTFANLYEYVRANRHLLRYNYDPEGLPQLRIKQLDGRVIESISGPEDPKKPSESHTRYGSGRSSSTYPSFDPTAVYQLICDRYSLDIMSGWAVLCVADGCNWGSRPQQAALRAQQGFVQYIKDQHMKMSDLKEVGHSLLRGFATAHSKIIEGMAEIWEAGTTTLLAGLVVELLDADKQDDYKYAFVCASVGDCKAFLFSPKTKQIIDVTAKNRGGMDATDPGGRLGPYKDNGSPDVRNLRAYFELCREGDIIVAMTDGIHDNLDPKSLGKDPADFGYPSNTWANLPVGIAEKIKQKFQADLLLQLLDKAVTAKQVGDTLIEYCFRTTLGCREWMEQHPKEKQPADYKKFPGKLDHCTCVSMTVGIKPPAVA